MSNVCNRLRNKRCILSLNSHIKSQEVRIKFIHSNIRDSNCQCGDDCIIGRIKTTKNSVLKINITNGVT